MKGFSTILLTIAGVVVVTLQVVTVSSGPRHGSRSPQRRSHGCLVLHQVTLNYEYQRLLTRIEKISEIGEVRASRLVVIACQAATRPLASPFTRCPSQDGRVQTIESRLHELELREAALEGTVRPPRSSELKDGQTLGAQVEDHQKHQGMRPSKPKIFPSWPDQGSNSDHSMTTH